MNLEKVNVSQFLRLGEVDLDLTAAPVALFAGENEAGKSSLVEAIRYALFGEVRRVNRKSDYKQMVRDGAKKGFVEVNVDGRTVRRDVATGKLADPATGKVPKNNEEPIPEPDLPERYRHAFDVHRFADLSPVDRRTLLMAATGTRIDRDKVTQKLRRRGITEEAAIERVLPLLRSGFEAAHDEAKAQAQQARADWKAITGENYGSLKAEDWTAPVPDVDENALAEAKAACKRAVERENAARDALAEAKAKANAGKPHARIAQLREAVSGLDDLRKRLPQVQEDEKAAQEDVDEALEKLRALQRRRHVMTCPCCSAHLVVADTELQRADEDPVTADELKAAEEEWHCVDDRVTELRNERARIQAALTRLHHQEQELAELEAMPDSAEDVDLAPYEQELQAALDERQRVEDNARVFINAKQGRDQAQQRTEQAAAAHKRVALWSSLQEAFAPDGIPGELLAEMLKPLNDRLAETARLTGWSRVQILADMTVTIDGRAYGLCSESAQWRADAALTDALVYASGMGVLVLDRIDVLGLNNQIALLQWIDAIAKNGDYERILLLGTYRALPPTPPTITAHWLEGGEFVEPEPQAVSA